MTIRTFRDLLVWQKGMQLTKVIYQKTVKMPESERFGLTNQMRRAAVSIPANIAEGFGRRTPAEYLRGQRVAMGSLCELMTEFELATELEMIRPSQEVLAQMSELDRMLMALILRLEHKRKE